LRPPCRPERQAAAWKEGERPVTTVRSFHAPIERPAHLHSNEGVEIEGIHLSDEKDEETALMTDSTLQPMSSRVSRRRVLQGAAALSPALAYTLASRHPMARAQDKPELTMWFDTTNGPETAQCMVDGVISTYGGDAVVKSTLQANNWDATRTALAGGEGPDLVGTPGPSFAFELAKAGQLLALDGYAASEQWSNSFVPWALSLGLVDGKLYSVPNEVETLVLYYNKTLFTEKGWAVPKTMDELMTLCQTIHDAEIIPFAHCNQEWRPANEWFVGEFMNQVAGPQKLYQALTGAAKFTDPEFVEAINDLNTMQQNGWFMGGLDRYYTTTFADADAAFAEGKAAMKIEGTWWISTGPTYWGPDAGNDNDWDWAPVPSKDGQPKFDLGIGSTQSINAKSEYPDQAAHFLTYFYSAESQAKMLTGCGLAPAPVSIPQDLLTGLDSRHAAILDALNQASSANNYGYTTWTFFPPKTETYLIETIEKVWAGDMTTEEYLQGIQDQFDEEMAAGDIPPIPAR
jgi:raffinose/stachyose/melibiose transport system substrate-binding protein